MKSHTTQRFRQLLADLPKEIQKQAREAYNQFEHNPYHPADYDKLLKQLRQS